MVTVYRGPFKDKYLLKVVDKYLGFEYYVSYRGLALHTTAVVKKKKEKKKMYFVLFFMDIIGICNIYCTY